MPRVSWFRSTSFRTGSVYAALFLVAVLAIFAASYQLARADMNNALQTSISSDFETLLAEHKDKGFPALKEAVDERLSETTDYDRLYALSDPSGAIVAGNIAALPVAAGGYEGPVKAVSGATQKSKVPDHVIGRVLALGDATLFVGRDAGAMEETLETLLGAFVIGGLGTAAAALVVGVALGRHSARRIGAMSETTRSIIATGLTDRILLKGNGDEFDMLSADINVMLDRIHGLMEGIRQISSDIAHDLRTPLSRMRHRLESSLRKRPASLRSYRNTVKQSVAEADGIITTFNALLHIAQIEGGARRSHFRTVDLSEVLLGLGETYAPVAEDAGLSLASDVQIGVRVNGDRELLTQLFANLIENAVRHGVSGGRIVLTLADCLGQIKATVADNGPGIPRDEREKVFRRLYRLEQSRTTAGHGLGLSLVAAVADLHCARVTLHDNRPGLRVEFDLLDGEHSGTLAS